jgi:hypothetical protein
MLARFALATALVAFAVGMAAADEAEPKNNAAAIKKLKVQRRDVLKQVLTLQTRAYEGGGGTYKPIIETSRALLQADLALATTKEERIAAHKARLDTAKTWEARVAASYKIGGATAAENLLAQSDRLEAEIGWLEAGGEEKKK